MKYAVIKTGGKQYLVKKGDILQIEKLSLKEGRNLNFKELFLIFDKNKVQIGRPLVKGANVEAKILTHGKGKKISVVKYKPKTRYHKKTGHRQPYTKIKILKVRTTGK